MKRTYVAKKEDIKRDWYILDAKDKVLGRIATKIAVVLRESIKLYLLLFWIQAIMLWLLMPLKSGSLAENPAKKYTAGIQVIPEG